MQNISSEKYQELPKYTTFHIGIQCGNPGVLEFGSLGVRESWSSGVLEFGSLGARESWSSGVPESGSLGVPESGSLGVLESWSLKPWIVTLPDRICTCNMYATNIENFHQISEVFSPTNYWRRWRFWREVKLCETEGLKRSKSLSHIWRRQVPPFCTYATLSLEEVPKSTLKYLQVSENTYK